MCVVGVSSGREILKKISKNGVKGGKGKREKRKEWNEERIKKKRSEEIP